MSQNNAYDIPPCQTAISYFVSYLTTDCTWFKCSSKLSMSCMRNIFKLFSSDEHRRVLFTTVIYFVLYSYSLFPRHNEQTGGRIKRTFMGLGTWEILTTLLSIINAPLLLIKWLLRVWDSWIKFCMDKWNWAIPSSNSCCNHSAATVELEDCCFGSMTSVTRSSSAYENKSRLYEWIETRIMKKK